MDWKAEALARVRRARLQANNFDDSIDDLKRSLHRLGGYDVEYTSVINATKAVIGIIIKDLFEIEGELSRTK